MKAGVVSSSQIAAHGFNLRARTYLGDDREVARASVPHQAGDKVHVLGDLRTRGKFLVRVISEYVVQVEGGEARSVRKVPKR